VLPDKILRPNFFARVCIQNGNRKTHPTSTSELAFCRTHADTDRPVEAGAWSTPAGEAHSRTEGGIFLFTFSRSVDLSISQSCFASLRFASLRFALLCVLSIGQSACSSVRLPALLSVCLFFCPSFLSLFLVYLIASTKNIQLGPTNGTYNIDHWR
jgi:hypothetical protein